MSSNKDYLSGSSTLPWSGSIPVPAVGAPVTAESVRHGFRALADNTRHLSASLLGENAVSASFSLVSSSFAPISKSFDTFSASYVETSSSFKSYFAQMAMMNLSASKPSVITSDLRGVAGNFTYQDTNYLVGVGNNGLIVYSDDKGQSWAAATAGGSYSDTFNDVVSGSGAGFIAVGESGSIQQAGAAAGPAGTWGVQIPDPSYYTGDINAIDWTPNRPGFGTGGYILVGDEEAIMDSADGNVWTETNKSGSSLQTVVAPGDGSNLVVAGASGTILYSSNTNSWSPATAANSYTGTFVASCYGNGKYVIAGEFGEIQYSTDGGQTWTHADAANGFSGIFMAAIYHNGAYFVLGDNGEIQTSNDAINWYSITTNIPNQIRDVVFANGKFFGTSDETSSAILFHSQFLPPL